MNPDSPGAPSADRVSSPDNFKIAATYNPSPTHVLSIDSDRRIWQLWICINSGKREWRPLPSFDDAHAFYGGVINP